MPWPMCSREGKVPFCRAGEVVHTQVDCCQLTRSVLIDDARSERCLSLWGRSLSCSPHYHLPLNSIATSMMLLLCSRHMSALNSRTQ